MRGEPISMVSLYDAPTAALCCEAGVESLLVGDSLGNVVLGHEGFTSATMEDMLRHTAAVARGVARSSRAGEVPVVADLPFGSYSTVADAAHNGAALIRAGAHALKLEGAGTSSLRAIEALVEMGAPVVGHLGFTPQSSLKFSGVVQGKTGEAAARVLEEARRLDAAGCVAVVLEAVPSEVAQRVTAEISTATIGIGAGGRCNGQVLVWHDMIGYGPGKTLRFVKRYADVHSLLSEAAAGFAREVRSGEFPAEEHGWSMSEEELARWQRSDGAEGGR